MPSCVTRAREVLQRIVECNRLPGGVSRPALFPRGNLSCGVGAVWCVACGRHSDRVGRRNLPVKMHKGGRSRGFEALENRCLLTAVTTPMNMPATFQEPLGTPDYASQPSHGQTALEYDG